MYSLTFRMRNLDVFFSFFGATGKAQQYVKSAEKQS